MQPIRLALVRAYQQLHLEPLSLFRHSARLLRCHPNCIPSNENLRSMFDRRLPMNKTTCRRVDQPHKMSTVPVSTRIGVVSRLDAVAYDEFVCAWPACELPFQDPAPTDNDSLAIAAELLRLDFRRLLEFVLVACPCGKYQLFCGTPTMSCWMSSMRMRLAKSFCLAHILIVVDFLRRQDYRDVPFHWRCRLCARCPHQRWLLHRHH